MTRKPRVYLTKRSFFYRCIAVFSSFLLIFSSFSTTLSFAGEGMLDDVGNEPKKEQLLTQPQSEGADKKDVSNKQIPEKQEGVIEEAFSDESPAEASDGAIAALSVGGISASERAIENLKVELKWLNVSDAQKYNLSWSDPAGLTNNTQTVMYRLGISSSNLGYEVGKLSIRIPQNLWKNRLGAVVSPTSLGIPLAPNVGTANIPFNYSIDSVTKELVITNTQTLLAASNYEVDVQYSIVPWDTIDGSKATFVAQATGTDLTGAVNKATSNTITYTVDTDVSSDNVIKSDGKPLYFWDSTYVGNVPQPADFNNYRWVTWRVVMGGKTNQPYNITLKDTPGQGGQLYAISDGDLTQRDLKVSDFTVGSDGLLTSRVFKEALGVGPANAPILSNGEGTCIRVLVRYPKTGGNTLENTIEETLRGVDGSGPRVTSSFASMTWKDYGFVYTGELQTMKKLSSFPIESQDSKANSLLALLQRGSNANLTWNMRMTANRYPGINYGKDKTYHGEMIDDVSYWSTMVNANTPAQAKTLMTKDDYQYMSARVYVSAYQIDRSNGQKKYYDAATNKGPLITVSAMTNEADGFKEVGSFFTSELSNASSLGAESKEFSFPEGTFRTKVSFGDTKDFIDVRMNPVMQLKASSPTIKTWFSNAAASGSQLASVRVQNFNYYQLYDEANKPLMSTAATDYRFDARYVDNSALAERDRSRYGMLLNRSSAGFSVTNLAGESVVIKAASNPINNSSEQSVHVDYWLHGRDGYNMTLSDYATLRAAGWPAPARDTAQFYDLLPRGMTYDSRQAPIIYDLVGRSDTSNMTVQTFENYRGTNRQMVVFNITSKQPGTNVLTGTLLMAPQKNHDGSVVYGVFGAQYPSQAGFTVKFRATAAWNKILYANKDSNLSAYQVPENDPFRGGGLPDDGTGSLVKDVLGNDGQPVFANLRGNGINKNIFDTRYLTAPTAISVPVALGSGLSKKVKADETPETYDLLTSVKPSGGYTYRLTVDTGSGSRMKRLVVFDILEEAKNTEGVLGETAWKGTLDSVDASDARLLGIEPVVYYSTTANLTYTGLTEASLTNTAVWSTQKPLVSASITAVAVDLRNQTNGNAFTFEPSTGVSILLHMKAPSILQIPQYAFNRSAYFSTLMDVGASEKTETNVGNRTRVELKSTPKFTKSSNPPGGTSAVNAITVPLNQEITYSLSFDPGRVQSRGIVIKDTLPAGLEFVPGSISFTPAGAGAGLPVLDAAYNKATGQITWPTYDQAPSGAAKFTFRVKASALATGKTYLLYTNKATASIGNEPVIDSNVITHQQFNRWVDITKTAALVDGVLATDVGAATAGTPRAESSGVQTGPVIANLGQIVEYRLIVKNTGAKQTSGEIQIADTLPQMTGYIKGSARAVLRSSANPSTSVSGSIATADIKEPSESDATVRWTLNKLSDGEEAYLTFRVSAPLSAFALGQSGMWAQLDFVNVAEMTDIAKGEKKTTKSTFHQVSEARLSATKQWDDADDKDKIRPQSILAQLYADGIASGSPVELTEGNHWSYMWRGLAVKNIKTEANIVYSVKEIPAAVGYEAPVYVIDAVDASHTIIINKRVPSVVVPPEEVIPPVVILPATGENTTPLVLALGTLVMVALVGFCMGVWRFRKQ